MRANRSVNAVMIVADRGLSLVVVAVVLVAIVVDPVRVVLVDRGAINVGLVEDLVDLTKIVVVRVAEVDFADRNPVVAEVARRSVETITVIALSARQSSRGKWS
jgi:hypothetical protein